MSLDKVRPTVREHNITNPVWVDNFYLLPADERAKVLVGKINEDFGYSFAEDVVYSSIVNRSCKLLNKRRIFR